MQARYSKDREYIIVGDSLSLPKAAISQRGARAARESVTLVKQGLCPGQLPAGPIQSIHRREGNALIRCARPQGDAVIDL